MPFFSITIPVYNVEKYIRQCLDSVLGQTFGDFEVIILDDGSTDQSGSICDEYAKKDSRIRVVHDINMGLLMARRRALQYVKGQYILFLDSDDYWELDLLESIHEVVSARCVDMVFFRYKAVNEEGKELYQQRKLLKDKELITDAGRFLIYQLATSFEYNSMVLKAVKKEKLDIDGDYSDVKGVSMGEDALQSARLASNIESMIYLEKPFYNYRVNISSISTKITKRHLADYLNVRKTIGDKMSKFYATDSKEYMCKIEYDIRGFVGLLADSSQSALVDVEEWIDIKKRIHESAIFHDAYLSKKNMNMISRIYMFFIGNGSIKIWSTIGYLKRVLKYCYDRLF